MTEDFGARKLAAIMSIDVAGFSTLAEVDEAEVIVLVTRLRGAIDEAASKHGGRIFNTAGDGFMLEFSSAAGALAAAELVWSSGVERTRIRILDFPALDPPVREWGWETDPASGPIARGGDADDARVASARPGAPPPVDARPEKG